jgi:hypothetical protein
MNQSLNSQFFNTERIGTCDFIQGRTGEYRAIVKVKAGFMTVVDDLGIVANWSNGPQWKSALNVFRDFKKGALQTIQFRPEGSPHWLTVFARTGNKVKLMDVSMFMEMQVGDINQNWSNTNLYSQTNYALAGAKTWASLAFAPNETKEPELV